MEPDIPHDVVDDFYRTLAENAAEGMLTIDEDSEIVYANAAIEDILGYTPAELIGSPKMKIIPERLQPVHASALRAFVETGDRNIDWDGMELPALHKDGHEVPTLISLREHEHGGEQYFTGIIRDVTARRRREEQLRDQKERLDEFADILAHDIRNPLTVAQGYTKLAQEEHDVVELDSVAESLRRIDVLVDDILALSKDGHLIGETELVDVERCVRAAWQNVDTGQATLECDPGLGEVDADESRFMQLLENLFRNAVEHGARRASGRDTPGDAVEHSSTSPPSHIQEDATGQVGETVTVRVGRTVDRPGLWIADDGPGIPEGLRANVFERGYTTADEGTGYGLSIVSQIADAHGWEVSVTESDRGGARFDITR
ncbi:PAS domain-containing sensor histidine kinase [Halobacteria archaeon HArc-gm2]|nr:PAS domain-containing sensor histidine kinase [Halobacteria archaeon HArc-gm2]